MKSFLEQMSTPVIEIRPASGRRLSPLVQDALELLPKLERLVSELRRTTEARVSQERSTDGQYARTLEICRAVAAHYELNTSDLLGESLEPRFAWPRQVAYYLARQLTPLGYQPLGGFFNRDRTTIMHGCRAVGGRASLMPSIKAEISQVHEATERRLQEFEAKFAKKGVVP